MGFSLFTTAPAQPESVSEILSQFTTTLDRLNTAVSAHESLIAEHNQTIEQAKAGIQASSAEISSAKKAAESIRALLG